MQEQDGGLVAERCGPHALVRDGTDVTRERGFLALLPAVPGQLFVLASQGVYRQRPDAGVLTALLRPLLGEGGVEAVWLAVDGLAADEALVRSISSEFDVDVLAPDGALAVLPGSGVHVGPGTGGTGWLRFRSDIPAWLFGTRFPVPAWDQSVPTQPITADGVVAEPVPAGLAVRDEATPPVAFGDLGFGVAVDARFPQAIVGGPGRTVPSAAAVAALLARLPAGPVLLVPGTPEVARPGWLAEIAAGSSRPVVAGTGVRLVGPDGAPLTVTLDAAGGRRFRPFPIVVLQPADGGAQEVLDVGPAPVGWERCGPRTYRPAGGEHDVLADVVPSGLVLHAATEGPAPTSAPFDPDGWTLELGHPGGPVGEPLLAAAGHLLAGFGDDQRATVRVRLTGTWDGSGRELLDRVAPGAVPASVDTPTDTPTDIPTDIPAASGPAPTPVPVPAWAGPLVTVSSGPVSSDPVSSDRGATPSSATREVSAEPVVDPVPVAADDPEPAPPAAALPAAALPADAAAPEATAEPVDERTGAAVPVSVPDRVSTGAEQTRFAAAAGDAFAEALATVNAALAAWPSLRHGDAARAKSDFVAVCLYFGRGDTGAARLNDAVRNGRPGVVDGHLACLVSGIRRLPTHRRPVLRQCRAADQPGVGSLLTEPGFLSASMNLDVTLPGADLDVLIWPSSARRTTELMRGRPVDEAVFVAGARFKALAVRTTEDDPGEDADGPTPPRVAVLVRELAPGEEPQEGAELDARDLAALAKLDRALAQRQRSPVRLVDDPEVSARLTTSLVAVGVDEEASTGRHALRMTAAAQA